MQRCAAFGHLNQWKFEKIPENFALPGRDGKSDA
jgi:hypothetical protein